MGMIRAGVEGERDVHGHWSWKLEAGKSWRDTGKNKIVISIILKTVPFGLRERGKND